MFAQPDETVDPAMLSLHMSSFPNVASFADALLSGRIDGTSLPILSKQIQSQIAPALINLSKKVLLQEEQMQQLCQPQKTAKSNLANPHTAVPLVMTYTWIGLPTTPRHAKLCTQTWG